MLVVIGTSFTAEYILKGVYEKSIGRLSEWTSRHEQTEEDRYAYKVARQYADFVHVRPFYEFHFARHASGLWRETHLWGPHFLRKLERKAFLTLDYTAEAFYCWLIEKLTRVTYGTEPADTYAWIDNADASLFEQIPHLRLVKQVRPRAFIIALPRYQEFTGVAADLAGRNVQFIEIAGNTQITVSVVAPQQWAYKHSDAQQVFSIPLLTRPEATRFILSCDVGSLSSLLTALRSESVVIEHVYDY